MYSLKVLNKDEVTQALKRIEKRKGKIITPRDLKDGDIFRFNSYDLNIFRSDGNTYSIFPAWSELLGSMCLGIGGLVSGLDGHQVTLLARKGDYPEPEKESPVKTIIYPRADGTVCCQNFVFYHLGQHFHITAERLAELKKQDNRTWLDSPEPCTCDLDLGSVREYDGHIHKI